MPIYHEYGGKKLAFVKGATVCTHRASANRILTGMVTGVVLYRLALMQAVTYNAPRVVSCPAGIEIGWAFLIVFINLAKFGPNRFEKRVDLLHGVYSALYSTDNIYFCTFSPE